MNYKVIIRKRAFQQSLTPPTQELLLKRRPSPPAPVAGAQELYSQIPRSLPPGEGRRAIHHEVLWDKSTQAEVTQQVNRLTEEKQGQSS